jgi:hypothetical protein
MSYTILLYYLSQAFKLSIFFHMWISKKINWGCEYVDFMLKKKIFYSLVFFPITTVWALDRLFFL